MTSMCPFTKADPEPQTQHQQAFERFIAKPDFPCVGARSALNRQRMRHGHYMALGSADSAGKLCEALADFSAEFADPGPQPVSFVASFESEIESEEEFERLLWQQLRLMHEVDRGHGVGWDPAVSSNPAHNEFSMSVAGRAFFIVGMFPKASRLARRGPMACLVFNFHDQFLALKASGKYASMQKVIRARDIELQGSINPVLARFGEASEARQYAGRAVPDEWICPFPHRSANDD